MQRVENIQKLLLIWAAQATVKAYQDGKYYMREKLMRKLFEIFQVFTIPKKIRYTGIPQIVWFFGLQQTALLEKPH